MTKKKKKKESWKEKRRQASLKRQKTLEAEQLRRERQPKRSKGWSRSKVLGIGFLILIAMVIGVYAMWQNSQPTKQLAPLFTLTDLDGNTVSLEDLRGKIVVLDFFATWCGLCKVEMPDVAQINENYHSNEVVIISIGHSSDSESDLRQFREDFNMPWAVARDTSAEKVFNKYNVGSIPTLVIIDQGGYIHYRKVGETDASTLSEEINKLLVS